MPLIDGSVPWPAETAERYRSDGTWAGETLGDLLRAQAARAPDNAALLDADRSFTYAELDRWVDRLAGGLVAAGLRAGDRVVLQLPNVAEHVAVSFAFFRMGGTGGFRHRGQRRISISTRPLGHVRNSATEPMSMRSRPLIRNGAPRW